MSEEQLIKKINSYQKLAAENKNVDLAALLLRALDEHQANMLSAAQKRWAYLGALLLPPLGLVFAGYFWFSGKEDGRTAALVCIFLTLITVISTALFLKGFLNIFRASLE